MAKIVQADANTVTVNFDGWSDKWNETYRKSSLRVRPFGMYNQGYSG